MRTQLREQAEHANQQFQLLRFLERMSYPASFLVGVAFIGLSGKAEKIAPNLLLASSTFFVMICLLFALDCLDKRSNMRAKLGQATISELILLILLVLAGSATAPVVLLGGVALVAAPIALVINLSPSTNQVDFVWFAAFAVLATGTTLYLVRLRLRFAYGLTEAVVGVALAVFRFLPDLFLNRSDLGLYVALLSASVYLVVRGADNMHQAWKEKSDPTVRLLLRMGQPKTDGNYRAPPRRLRRCDVASRLSKRAGIHRNSKIQKTFEEAKRP